jgi:hypothetical protein
MGVGVDGGRLRGIGKGKDGLWQTEGIRWLSRALWALALAGLAYLAGLTVWLGIRGLLFPYQLDYGEGVHLYFVRQWARGQPIYKTIEGYPYITFNYAPLAILLALALTPVLGINYAAGRLWALVATVAASALIALWVRRESGKGVPALAAALLFFGSPYVYHWAPLFRVDLVGLALTLGGLYCVLVAVVPAVSGEPGTGVRCRWLWLAVVLFVAGLYAKQSFVFAPAAALLYLFFLGKRRHALGMALATGLLGGGLFVVINALTGGGFWDALVASNVNPFLWPEFWKQQADFFGTFAILAALSAWYLVDKFALDRRGSFKEKVSLLDLYLLAALGSLGLAGKAGAWENYFFEALAALVLCGGLGLARLIRRPQALFQLLAPVLVLVQVVLMWHTPRIAERYMQITRESNEAMIPILARTPDPIISEDMGLLVTNGKRLDYHSFQYSQLARAGRWDQAWELGQLRQGKLSSVILEEGTRLDVDHYQRFTREFLSELDRNYRHARTVGKYELYEPDPLQHERGPEDRAEFGDQLAIVGWSLAPGPAPSTQGGSEAFLQAGQPFSLTVVWQAQQALSTDYTAFAQVVDGQGQGWAGDDHQPYDGLYPTSAWGAGEMVRDSFTLAVPADAPPGLYDVYVGWYDPASQERLPVGQGDAFHIATVPVGDVATELEPQSVSPVQARFGEKIVLEGYAWEIRPTQVEVLLRWSTDAFLDVDYVVFVHLVEPDDGDRLLAQGDGPPAAGRWPTSHWLPGVALDDVHTIDLPEALQPGTYHLLVGLYDPVANERVLLDGGGDFVRLPGLEIR